MILALTVALTIVSCDRKSIYAHYEHTDTYGWEKNDTLVFNIPSLQHSQTYHEEVGIRNNHSYPFKSLTLYIEQTVYPKGEKKVYTLNCRFVDDKGFEAGSGVALYQYNFPVADIKLQAGDSLHIRVTHHMKREILPGISDVGVMLSAK